MGLSRVTLILHVVVSIDISKAIGVSARIFVSRRADSHVGEVRFYSVKDAGLPPGKGGAQDIGHVGEQPPPAFSRIDSNIRVAIVSRCEARSLFIIRQLVRSWTEHLVIYPVEESPPPECPVASDQIDNGARLLEDSG